MEKKREDPSGLPGRKKSLVKARKVKINSWEELYANLLIYINGK